MSRFIWWTFVAVSLVAIYWFIVRPWLARQPLLQNVYAFLDRKNAGLFSKFRVSMSGLKRKLSARLVWVASLLVAVHDFALPFAAGDLQPLIPEAYRQFYPFATIAIGMLFEYLSKISPTPVGEVNPGVIASTTETSIKTVAAVTAPDPVVATPTQDQMKAAS